MIPLRALLLPSVFVAAGLAACAPAPEPTDAEFHVTGMTCDGCEQSIRTAVGALPGVSACSADHETGRVSVRWDAARTPRAEIVSAIRTGGYQVEE